MSPTLKTPTTPKTLTPKHSTTIGLQHTLHACKDSRISKAEKSLHEACARAFTAAAKGPKNANDLKVTVPLQDLSSLLIDYRKLMQENEGDGGELDLTLWEGRYTDYVAFTLHKVKSTAAWGAVPGLGDLSWVEVKRILDYPPPDGSQQKILNALHAAVKSLTISYTSARIAIDVYADRCGGPRHHGGSDILVKAGRWNVLAEKILSDRGCLTEATPRSRQHAVTAVRECIRVYENTFFTQIKRDGSFGLTVEGMNAHKKAQDRIIKPPIPPK